MSLYKVLGTLMAVLAIPGSVLADSGFPINEAVNVQYQSNLFPNGYVDAQGTIVGSTPGTTSGTFRSGIFGLQYNQPSVPGVYNPFKAICIDANEHLFSGTQLYYVQSLASFPSFGPYTDGPTPSLTPARKLLLEKLFTVAWNDAQTSSLNSAAFQWAAWEIGREQTAGSSAGSGLNLTLVNGDILTSHTGVRDQATQFLNRIESSTVPSSLLILSPVTFIAGSGYVRVSGQELLTLSPVPEPAAMVIPLAAGFALMLIKRRRSQGLTR